MGLRADQVVKWCRQAVTLLLTLAFSHVCLLLLATPGLCHQDAVHITAILGESVVFNCHVEFPGDHPVPYVLQWEKKVGETGLEIPIYIWYDTYPTHSGEGYEGRVSRVSPDSPYGLASLNLTNIRESDQGWYECKVVFLNRSPPQKNGTWFHLDVHAPPRFSVTPEDIIYVNLGDAIILNCQAEGTPTPEILWYKDANPVEPSATIGIFNDGTELRISNIRHEDIGDYTCIARNGEGQISHTARVIIAGGAVIMVPPTNQTKLEGEKVQFSCEAKALPGNVTVKWYREAVPVKEVAALETRVTIRRDGSLIVNPVSADDSGQYLCEVTNGIGEPQSAAAYLNVEYPAKVTFTPTVQFLPFRLAGVVQCYIKANPPLQYVTWTKDKRLLEPYQTEEIVIMNNGSLLFTRVNQDHEGRYTCTPYNAQGTQGSSGPMEVLVRKPPVFTIEPDSLYQRKVGESVEMHCDAQETEGTQKPTIQWQRRDGSPLQRNRVRVNGGNITINGLRRTDFGFYQCVASNEVATIVTATQLVVEGTQPHAPYNVSANASETAVTLQWLPGYSGGPDYKQDYTIWYREAGVSDWSTIPVTPSGSTQVTINRLASSTTYEFQVVGKNALGDGMLSKVITVRTLDIFDYSLIVFPTDSTGATLYPPILRPRGPKPGPPRNLTVTEINNGFLITWQSPLERAHLVQYYTIKYKTDSGWKTLNKGSIRPEETSYLVKNLVGGRTYYFRVLANSLKSYESSEEVKYPVPARVKHKAITAGVVGGILFFIVAIILSVCAVKICNKRKRRKQEKAYNMVACRVTDARNGGQPPGASQVPLKKLRQSRIPSVTLLGDALKRTRARLTSWLASRGCGDGEGSQVSSSSDAAGHWRPEYIGNGKSLGRISRAADGRFVLADSSHSSAANSVTSSSDDGGFLPRRGRRRASWRRPLVGYPSQLSLRSDGSGESGVGGGLTTILDALGGRSSPPRYHHHLPLVPTIYSPPPAPTPRFRASSPATPGSLLTTAWSPSYNYSDLSSVPQLSSVERSLPTGSTFNTATPPSYLQLRTVHERYSQELPSLRAIHEESSRWQQRQQQQRTRTETYPPTTTPHLVTSPLFLPVHPLATSSPPRVRIPPPRPALPWAEDLAPQHPGHGTGTMATARPRARLPPRHARHARSAPELADAEHQDGLLMETSPSSSSGFGSKNTSQQNQSSQSGSTSAEWRLPPYRPPPPPPPPPPLRPSHPPAPPPLVGHWLEFTAGLQDTSPPHSEPGRLRSSKPLDASVDDHYEFDTVFAATPTPSTPTGVRTAPPRQRLGSGGEDRGISDSEIYSASFYPPRPKRPSKYDNIEARVQAMKEEFHEFRKRQAKRRRSEELESAC
ncbi:protein turtle isoform X2 [Periplaneta americana]|uniref:protein turtle isoform X2 n=1 Tax=Periplaneta americana TaxID=6978 RepID=UPI0037E95465